MAARNAVPIVASRLAHAFERQADNKRRIAPCHRLQRRHGGRLGQFIRTRHIDE
jgi:hypothetical protein